MLQTEYEFKLPLGFLDEDGNLHREGVMRLATAADEILPLRDPRVRRNEAYLAIVLLSRVVTRLGALDEVTPKVVEGLFAADLGYLQDLYNRINSLGDERKEGTDTDDEEVVQPGVRRLGGSSATPSTVSSRR